MNLRYIVVGVVAVGVAVTTAIFLFSSEEKKVKKQFRLLSEGISKETHESAFAMAQKMQRLGTLFTDPCEITLSVPTGSGSFSPEEIVAYAAQARLQCSELSLTFFDLHVTFPEPQKASVTTTGKVTGTLPTGERIDETREVVCGLTKIDDRWCFNKIEVIDVLKK